MRDRKAAIRRNPNFSVGKHFEYEVQSLLINLGYVVEDISEEPWTGQYFSPFDIFAYKGTKEFLVEVKYRRSYPIEIPVLRAEVQALYNKYPGKKIFIICTRIESKEKSATNMRVMWLEDLISKGSQTFNSYGKSMRMLCASEDLTTPVEEFFKYYK